jgi:hypothetical protein
LALRAAGAGLNVYIAQFIKSGDYSEIKALARFADRITVEQFGLGRFIKGKPSPEDVAAAQKGLKAIRSALTSGDYQVVIMEEGNVAAMCGLFPVDEILEIMTQNPAMWNWWSPVGERTTRHRQGRSGDGNESGQTLLPGRGGRRIGIEKGIQIEVQGERASFDRLKKLRWDGFESSTYSICLRFKFAAGPLNRGRNPTISHPRMQVHRMNRRKPHMGNYVDSRPKAPCLAVLGTGSDVGKSVIAAALCRIFADRGLAGGALQGPEHVQQLRGHAGGAGDGPGPDRPGRGRRHRPPRGHEPHFAQAHQRCGLTGGAPGRGHRQPDGHGLSSEKARLVQTANAALDRLRSDTTWW